MDNYQIGKDVAQILERLERLERLMDDSLIDDSTEGETSEVVARDSVELSTDELEKFSGYKYIIYRVELNRRCWRELPLNKAYMNWAAKCWSHLAKSKDDLSGPPYTCKWIKLRYNYGSKDCVDASSCSHTSGKRRHCHGGTLTGSFHNQSGKTKSVAVTI